MKLKNKLFSLLALGLAALGIVSGVQTVQAASVNLNMTDSGWYWQRTNLDNTLHSWNLTLYDFNGRVAYCIEPGVPEGTTYQTGNFNSISGFTNEQKERMLLIAYYGYEYPGHQTLKYRAATQAMLWETVGTSRVTYSSQRWASGTIYNVDSERNEIERLVRQHYTRPSFNGQTFTGKVGQEISIVDNNNVLNNFEVSASNGADVRIEGNTLKITPKQIGDIKLSFKKKLYTSTEYLIYTAGGAQNMISSGAVDPALTVVNVKSKGGDIEFNKYDKDNNNSNPLGEATLEGAVYGVYDANTDALLLKGTTDKNGYAKISQLPYFGEFYLQEITPSKGYQLDNTKYRFTSSLENIDNKIVVREKVINTDIDITKVYATDESKIMTPEPNVEFGFYDYKGELYKKATTDKNGKLLVNLVYGNYTVKQLTTSKDTFKVKDFKINVSEMNGTKYYVLSNAEITSKLKVYKIDADTKEVIPRAGIKFKIIDKATGKSVKQTITYPEAKTLEIFETDKNGVLITPYPLNSGTYYLEEVDQVIDGYLWNKQSVEFTIGENSELIEDSEYGVLFEVKFENKRVEGEVNIQKKGEEVKFTDDGYEYSKINLSNVKLGLYAKEDITLNGKVIYRAGTKIKEVTTDENGKVKISKLYLGKYYLQEIETDENHVLDNKKYEFELKYKDQYTEVIKYNITIDNYLKKGNLEFTKTDLTTGKVIPNTKVEIYTEDDKLIYSGETNEEGKITITDLFTGKFYIVETEASTGYKLSDEKVYLEIKDNGEVIKANMTNEKITGSLEFTKVDFSTDEPLPNTLIEIYNENDELVFSGRTDENGKIIIEKLEYGKYYILEKEAPEGYLLNEEKMYFEILEDGIIVKSTMKDEAIPVEVDVPNTNKNELPIIPISIACSLLGLGLIIYGKKKN